MAILQKGMPVQFTSGQDSSRYPYVQLSTGDDSRVIPVVPTSGDAARTTTFQIQSGGDPSRVPMIQIQGPPLTDMAAWFVYGAGITVTGAGVSQWSDQSGNARHLLQGTDTNRPALQADGSILFDGVDNYLKCSTFTFAQPETIYLLFKQVTWTASDYIFDGNTLNSGECIQSTSSPIIVVGAASTIGGNGNLAVDTYGVLSVVISGASTLSQVNNTTAVTGNSGLGDMAGFTLGGKGNAANAFGNIQVKEVILYSGAHDATTRAQVINYLARVGGLSI